MKKHCQKINMHIEMICYDIGYMYYVKIYWKCNFDELYSVDNVHPLHQIYHVYAIPVYFLNDEPTRYADHHSLSIGNMSLNNRSMSEILSSHTVSIYDDRYNHYIQTTNPDVNTGDGPDFNTDDGTGFNPHGAQDFNPGGEQLHFTHSRGQQSSLSALPSPTSRSPLDYVNITRSSECSSHLSGFGIVSSGRRQTSILNDVISASNPLSASSVNTASVASSPVNVSGARRLDIVSQDDYVQFPQGHSNQLSINLVSGHEIQNRNVIRTMFIQEENEMTDSLPPQLRSSIFNKNSDNERQRIIRDDQRQNITCEYCGIDLDSINLNYDHMIRSYAVDRATGNCHCERNLVNDHDSIGIQCSEDNIPNDITSYPFDPAQYCFMTKEESLRHSSTFANSELPFLRNQFRRSRELVQYNTRPPEPETSEGLLQSDHHSTRHDQEAHEIRLVHESLDPRMVQRMVEKGYTENQILAASVYFYRSEGHLGISVSKLVEILESSYWTEIFKDV